MRWTRESYVARETPVEDLQAALAALGEMLRERLPVGASDLAGAVVDRAAQALAASAAPAEPEEDAADPSAQIGPEALTYLRTILEGRPREAIDRLLAAVDAGTPVREIYLDVLVPAQREAGRLWHLGELDIVEEHVVTTTGLRAMAILCEREKPAAPNGKGVLLACVAGNVHSTVVQMVAHFFEMAGWRTINLGADVPGAQIAAGVRAFDVDLVVLAVTLDPHLKVARQAIQQIRGLEGRDVKIVVGGSAFANAPEVWREIGADGCARRLEDAEPLGASLTG